MSTDENATGDVTETPSEDTAPAERPAQEAAKYRHRLRAAEAERDALREQVAGFQKRELESLATAPFEAPVTKHDDPDLPDATRKRFPQEYRLLHAEDLWSLGGVDPATLIAPDGAVDQEALGRALGELLEARPELFQMTAGGSRNIGRVPPTPTFSQAAPLIEAMRARSRNPGK